MHPIVLFILLLLSAPAWTSWSGIGGDAQHSGTVASPQEAYPTSYARPLFSTPIQWSSCKGMPLVAPFGDAVWYSSCENGKLILYLANATEIGAGTPTRTVTKVELNLGADYQPPAFSLDHSPIVELSSSRKYNVVVLPLGFSVYFVYPDGKQQVFTPAAAGPVRRAFSSAAVLDDVLGQAYVADEDGLLFAFDLKSNPPAPIWNSSFATEAWRPLGIPSSPVVSPDGGFICVTFTPRHLNMSDPALNFTGSVTCMNSSDGSKIVHFEPNATLLGRNSPVLEVTPSISVDSTKVYVGTRRGIIAFNMSNPQNASLPIYIANGTLVSHAIGTPLVLWDSYGVAYALSEDCHLSTYSLANGSLIGGADSLLVQKYCPDHLLPHGEDRRHTALVLDALNNRLIVSTGDWMLSLAISNATNGFMMPQLTSLQWDLHVSSCRKSSALAVTFQPSSANPTLGAAFYSACEAESVNIKDKMFRYYFFEGLSFNPQSVTAAPALPSRHPTSLIVKISLGVGFPLLFIILGLLGVFMWRRAKNKKRNMYTSIQS